MTAHTQRPASEAELLRIAEFNRTEAAFPDSVTLVELIEAQVAKHPSRTAVICDHDPSFAVSTLTYAQLNEKVNQLAHRLRAEGVLPGQVVALMVERSFAMAIGILAILKAGAAYLPLSTENPPDRTEFMLSDGGVSVLLLHGKTADKIQFKGTVLDLNDPGLYQGSTDNPVKVNTPRDLAYVIYTSGSTGRPKGVMIEHGAVVNRLHWMQRRYPIGADDVILQKTPYYFDVSVWELLWWALEGAAMCFLPPKGERHPLIIVDTIKKHKATVMHFVPSMLAVFLEYLDGKTDAAMTGVASVRRVFTSGEALAPGHVRKFNDLWGGRTQARLTNLYGPTEATVDVSYFDCPTGNDFDVIPIGRPIDNIKLYVIRDTTQVGIGEDGELLIAGVGLARGYFNNPALTSERFTDNPVNPGERVYRTGDIARWLADGNVEYLGREDHQVKIRGLRIELGEIENRIRECPGIVDCVVVTKKYSESVILIVAYMVPKGEVAIEDVKAHLKRHLPDYMVPNHFEKIAEMPLTPSGKADRKALPEPVIHSRGV
jgi:tyrocidine synthetase-3